MNSITMKPITPPPQEDAKLLIHKIEHLITSGDVSQALRLATDLAKNTSNPPNVIEKLAFIFSKLKLYQEALEQYQLLTQFNPGNGSLYYNIATMQRFLGDIKGAINSLNTAVSLDPSDYEAVALRSDISTQTPDSNHIEELKTMLAREATNPREKVKICYALAKELEDTGDYEQSFTHLKQGADTRRGYMQYRLKGDLKTIDAIQKTYNHTFFTNKQPSIDNIQQRFDNQKQSVDNKQGCDSSRAIFIIGLPRTGTTLVERVLGSHSQIIAAGELNNFAIELVRLTRNQGIQGKPSPSELVPLTTSIDFSSLGQAYIDSTRDLNIGSAHFIDKMPLNYLYAGLIHLALPNAKIINLTRHPMDACYAIYKRLFKNAYPFSYSLEDIGHYYLAYHQLMNHWQSVMPGIIHRVAYEDVVHDIEGESKKLLAHCDLPWEPQCLNFHKSRDASTTASAAQVRKPIYNSSIEKWKLYEEQLQPLAKILTAGAIDIS